MERTQAGLARAKAEGKVHAHHWARKLQALGHTVRLMAPQFVKSYVKSNKNDAADAEAICEAVARPSMRFVAIKNIEQQAVLSLHRVRQGYTSSGRKNYSGFWDCKHTTVLVRATASCDDR